MRDAAVQLQKLLLQAAVIVDLTNHQFKNRVLEELRNYFSDFLAGLSEFLGRQQEASVLVS